MRSLYSLNKYREHETAKKVYGWSGDDKLGMFLIPSGDFELRVIASNGDGWDHVSVSLEHRCPTWEEMEYIKHLFFEDDETAMQLHVPSADHISFHDYCLHLWRPHPPAKIPRPPQEMVGPPKSS
jgi:hypothetical protein